MSPTKRNISRSTRRRSESDDPQALRRGREHRGVRWIGAAKRRAKKLVAVAGSAPVSAQIIRLSCADTFSRPIRPGVAGTFTQVLLFQARALWSERQAADQSSVPFLR